MLAVPPVDGVGLVRRLLRAAQAKSADVPAQLHPAWVQMAWQRAGITAPPDDAAPGWSAALAAVYGLQWTSLVRFRQAAHRIALLPRGEVLRVLAAVALHVERERVRHSIGRGLRAAMIERVGEVAYAGIVAACGDRAGGSAGSLAMADLQPEALAARGFAALRDHGHWHSNSIAAWVRLALAPAPSHAAPAPSHAAPASEGTHASDTAGALQRLSLYFPEHAWLFGSPMDRALSVSTTA